MDRSSVGGNLLEKRPFWNSALVDAEFHRQLTRVWNRKNTSFPIRHVTNTMSVFIKEH